MRWPAPLCREEITSYITMIQCVYSLDFVPDTCRHLQTLLRIRFSRTSPGLWSSPLWSRLNGCRTVIGGYLPMLLS